MRSLLSLVAICVVASALTTRSTTNSSLPLTVNRRFSLPAESGKTLVLYERQRVQQLIARNLVKSAGGANVNSIPVDNALISYNTEVKIGNPPTSYLLDCDTGSSLTFVGAGKPFVSTSTTIQTPNNVSESFGSGFFSGIEVIDQVELSPGLVINKQSIGVALETEGFNDIDGILGLGPTDLTIGLLSPATNSEVPTVVDNLRSQGTIQESLVSIFFAPETSLNTSSPTGELTFGTTDPTKITTPITFVPITKTSPSSTFWGIDQSITYAGQTILNTTAGFVDSGTTLLFLSSDGFENYQSATGAVLDDATGLLRVTQAQFDEMQSLDFHIGAQIFHYIPNAQLLPRNLNIMFGGVADALYLIFADIGTPSGSGVDFVNGYVFLERFYSVYDTDNQRVGFAETAFTNATTN